ncbi:Lipoamide acyltransferase component of branched-chain alpha-keto acid dehydrogenase complex, mitochondrial [Fonsecaea pedrosoi]|nr:Lipoamide acyltransferase component of branched-chain alpha-keto acid dehydrogenase complex, mitochondrial [Fonsecaea pedrosoi]
MNGVLVRGLVRQSQRLAGAAAHCPSRQSFHSSPSWRVVRPYLLADIGEGITECQIINWSVKPGDHVAQFDPICEVQSDKATVEITSRFDGVVKALHYEQDEVAIVGKPLLDMDIADEIAGDSVLAEVPVEQESTDIEQEPGKGIMTGQIEQPPSPLESHSDAQAPSRISLEPATGQNTPSRAPALLTPAVRHLLKQAGIDVNDVEGTGRDGRITKDDVQRYIQSQSNSGRSQPTPPVIAPPSKKSAEDKVVSFTPTEKHMFKVMTQSLTIPHFLYTHSVDVTSINLLRQKFNTTSTLSSTLLPPDVPVSKLTVLPFILKALSQAFSRFPKLNAHLDTATNPSNPQLILRSSHNFGIAVDTPHGLLVPVVKNVQNHSIISLAAEIKRLSDLAQAGRLAPEDFKDATFTISNIGSIGGSAVAPVIVAPMVGILGVGRAQGVPVFTTDKHGGEHIIKQEQVVLSWSADHRVLDGATVAKAAEVVGTLIQNAESLGLALQ